MQKRKETIIMSSQNPGESVSNQECQSKKTVNQQEHSSPESVKRSESDGTDHIEKSGGGGSGRERLKKHRMEVAGRVWIPEMWGHDSSLKDWIDCTVFDAALVNSSIMSARAALVEQGRRAASSTKFGINNTC